MQLKLYFPAILLLLLSVATTHAQQGIAVNATGNAPDASAMLDVQSTAKGMLVPRMTTAQRTGIGTPATGLLVFDTDSAAFFFYKSGTWTKIATGNPAGADNLGNHTATQNVKLDNNWLSNDGTATGIRVDNSGNVGIGMTGMTNKLDVSGNIQANTGTVIAKNPGLTPSGSTVELSSPANDPGIIIRRGDGAGSSAIRWDMKTTSDAALRWRYNNSNDRMYLSSAGNLGLGTTVPAYPLQVSKTTGAQIDATSTGGSAVLSATAPAGSQAELDLNTYSGGAASLRWVVGKSNGSEPGSNAGSDFYINRFDDNGVFLSQPLNIKRNTGYVGLGTATITERLTVNGNIKTADTVKTGRFQMTGGATSGYVLTSDASGNATWAASAAGADNLGNHTATQNINTNGKTISADGGNAGLLMGNNGQMIDSGTYASGTDLSISGAGTRMMWLPKKAAFRAGTVDGSQWNNSNIGDYSVAMGTNVTAGGTNAVAFGSNNSASGAGGFVVGALNTASGTNATALGQQSTASGYGALANGLISTASGNASFASGYVVNATGARSVAIGDYATASGANSVAIGRYATAANPGSMAFGDSSTTTVSTDAANQIKARFKGGYKFYANEAQTNGIQIAATTGVAKYFNNVAASYDARSLTDKNYVDSNVAAAVAAVSVTESDPQVSSATTNKIPKWNGTTLTDGLLYDNGAGIGLGTTSPDANALVDMQSTTKGFLMPRMSTTERLAISSPQKGMMVYDSTQKGFYFYRTTGWTALSISGASVSTSIQDADADTKIQTEQTADEDKIRFTLGGTEYFRMNKGTLEWNNTGSSVYLGEAAGANDAYIPYTYNIGIGPNSLQSLTSGGSNVAIGRATMNQASGGDNNVALGYLAEENMTLGSENTAVGSKALRNIGANIGNTALGRDAGHSATGDYNVFLGYQAGYSATGGNQLYIDNSNTAAPLVYGNFAADSLRINGKLNINGYYSLPQSAGANGYVLTTNGAGQTSWASAGAAAAVSTNALSLSGSSITSTVNGVASNALNISSAITAAETDPQVSSATTSRVPRWTGTTLSDGAIYDNGTSVGIGTTTLTDKLNVLGNSTLAGTVSFNNSWNIQTGSDYFLERNGTRFLTIYGTGGNTGIGTSTPGAKLDVNGNFKMGSSGSVLSNIIKVTVTSDILVIGEEASYTQTFSVPGAVVGASVSVSPSTNLGDGLVIAFARVSAAGQVTVRVQNTKASFVPYSNDLYITVIN